MKIINPIYDQAFKYLMDNEPIAKLVLSIILDAKVISLQSKPQETPIFKDGKINLSRFDFKALIRKENEEEVCVLIELQKYKYPDPIGRFRQYLAENYMKKETYIDSKGNEITAYLPIKTIYILGFIIDKDHIAMKSEPTLTDAITNKKIEKQYDFFNLLTNGSIVLQPKLKISGTTRLEKFIKLFSQKLEGDDSNYIIDIDDMDSNEDNEFKKIVSHLNQGTLDEELLRTLKYEKSYEEGVETLETQLEEANKKADAERQKADAERQLKEEANKKADAERQKADTERQKIINMVLKRYNKQMTVLEIVEDLGLSEKEILEIIKNK